MPKGTLPRWKVIRCRTCGKVIQKFDRTKYNWHVPAGVILAAIRRHYKRNHPKKFRTMVRKATHTRKAT